MPGLRLILLALAFAALVAPAAQAADDQVSMMMDDDLLLYRDDSTRFNALQQMKSLGVDTVRVTVLWKVVADGAGSRIDADDPGAYPTRNWDRYDNLVKDAQRLGIQVYFNVTGPGPRWAHRRAPRWQRSNQATYKPYAGKFRQFVEAVGTRFSGSYPDENATRQPLPRVSFWSIWNEPNQAGWLTPQWEPKGSRRTRTPASPALYRELYHFGHKGLVASGHGGDTILLGETAPLGSSRRTTRSPMRPGLFLRELMCVTSSGRTYRGTSARRRECGDFRRRGALKATGFAHHPYTKGLAPTRKPRREHELTMANIGSLGTLLDRLAERTHDLPIGLPLYMTEFGYESAPPDPHHGVDLDRQARYNQLGDFLAYTNPRVKSQTQFLLRDVAPIRKHKRGSRAYWFTYQSGLFFLRGQPKPAAFAYVMPFVAFDEGPGRVGFWGQLRFRPNGAQDVAHVQWRPADEAPWQDVASAPVNPQGFFTAKAAPPGPGGDYRAAYKDPSTGQVRQYSLSTTP